MIAASTSPNDNCAPPGRSTTIDLARRSALKSIAISGLKIPSTSAVTTAVNATPTTKATARSMTLPRIMNSLNPLSMADSPYLDFGAVGPAGEVDGEEPAGRLFSLAAGVPDDFSPVVVDFSVEVLVEEPDVPSALFSAGFLPGFESRDAPASARASLR